MPLKEWKLTDELQEKSDLYEKYSKNLKMLESSPITEFETPIDTFDFKHDSTTKAYEEGRYLAQGGEDHPNMRIASKQTYKMPTPDEAQEEGVVKYLADGTSDFVKGLAIGGFIGVDELAASVGSLSNSLAGTDEYYTGRHLSKYMHDIQKRHKLNGDAANAGVSLGQFIAGFLPSLFATQGLGVGLKGAQLGGKALERGVRGFGDWISKGSPANVIASFMAGATAYSPNHKNLGNDLATVDNYLAGEVSRYLATNPNSPESVNRLRNALQEAGLAIFGDTVVAPIIKGGVKIAGQAIKPVHELFIKALDVHKQSVGVKVLTNNGTVNQAGKKVMLTGKDGMQQIVDEEKAVLNARTDLSLTPKTQKAELIFKVPANKTVAQALADNESIQNNILALPDMQTRQAYLTSITDTLEKLPKQTTAEWSKQGLEMVRQAGMDVETLRKLDESGTVSAPMIYAIGHMSAAVSRHLDTAIENTKNIMNKVDVTNDEIVEAQADFVRALADELELAQMFENAGTRGGKALRAVNTVVKDLGENFKKSALNSPDGEQVLDFFRRSKIGGVEIPRVVDMLATARLALGQRAMHKVVRNGFKSGTMSAFVEYWINQGLLSNPATHILNLVVGGLNLTTHVGSQFAAAGVSAVRRNLVPSLGKAEHDVTFREAFGSLYGMVAGLSKAMQLSLKAGVTGKSAWGQASKIDNYGMQHFAASTYDLEGTGIGLGIDYMGSLIRSSGRFLLLEDEFVKTVAGEMFKHSKAWRYAYSNTPHQKLLRKLGRKPIEDGNVIDHYKELIDNPQYYKERIGEVDYSIERQMQEFADLVTFQQQLGRTASSVSEWGVRVPLVKIGIPFVKVLTNIPKYTLRHSPAQGITALHPMMSQLQTTEFQRGGQARMLEIGRMTYGTMMMIYGGYLYLNGNMTDSGPREYWKAINSKDANVEPPQSIKVKPVNAKAGDNYWIDISRFSPYSNLLQMGADIAKMSFKMEDANLTDHIWKAVTSVQKNLVDPTFAPALHKTLGVIADSSNDQKDWNRAFKSIVGSTIPAWARSVEKRTHPGKSELKPYDMHPERQELHQPSDWTGYVAQMLATSSSHSDLVPTKRNFLGDQVKHDLGKDSGIPGILHDPMYSFLTIRKADETPVLKHVLTDLELEISRPSHILRLTIGGKSTPVRLTPYEYDEYVRRIGKMENHLGHNLKDSFAHRFKNDPLYRAEYNRWKQANPTGKAQAKIRMKSAMNKTYNQHQTLAKQSMIEEFNLRQRAIDIRKQYGTDIDELAAEIN